MSERSAKIMERALELQPEIKANRRHLHQHAEISLSLPETKAYVKNQLISMGYSPIDCGESGLIALAGGKKPGKVFLVRADMDALPIKEQSDVDFACTNGNMHACGHDNHAAMLLGAAKILKEMEDDICGTVKLMFQPGEETFLGCKEMIDNGVLENPKVDAAMMIHIATAMPFPVGTIVAVPAGTSTAAQDAFRIDVQGRGCHGAMPDTGVDPINVACHIHSALQTINSREIAPGEMAVITTGIIQAGAASNIIPDTAMLSGSIRTFRNETREFIKKRVVEISELTAKAFRAEAVVNYIGGCPSLFVDKDLHDTLQNYAMELMPKGQYLQMELIPGASGQSGSEDFGFISQQVPSTMYMLTAGMPKDGFIYPQHHPKARFNDDILYLGTAFYAYLATQWLEEHK